MDNKEHGGPPHLEGPNNRNDDGCIYCPCFGDAVCLECQEMAELRARWTRNERDDSDRDTPLDIDDESDTSLDLNDIENVDETCTGARNVSACRISSERADLSASYSNKPSRRDLQRKMLEQMFEKVKDEVSADVWKEFEAKSTMLVAEMMKKSETDYSDMPELEETKENKEDSDEDSDELLPLEVI